MREISGGDPAVKSNSVTALAWLYERSITSAAGPAKTARVESGAAKSEECAAEDRSSGIVWQSCWVAFDSERSFDLFVGFLHRRVSQQCPFEPGHMKNCSHETQPPHR